MHFTEEYLAGSKNLRDYFKRAVIKAIVFTEIT